MNAPEHIILASFMQGRGVHACVSELYISAALSFLPSESIPPATYAFSPALVDPNRQSGEFIGPARVHEFVRMLYLYTMCAIPNTSSSVPTARDSLSEHMKHSSCGILGTSIQRPQCGS
ncbi:hypothetical protein CFC21_106382 [Triticum aestivum]|uniref:Uncharacterized protein n=2 Tax=Triticum aestivum TaxID=4565 RepID=A0A9R1ME71_WHEAT|nr:hypothetical protein CFC21_106382 [Triticum aestivum]